MPDQPLIKLSVRRSEAVANALNQRGQGRITAIACRWKTPEQVAAMYLGGRASRAQINALVSEIYQIINIPQPKA